MDLLLRIIYKLTPRNIVKSYQPFLIKQEMKKRTEELEKSWRNIKDEPHSPKTNATEHKFLKHMEHRELFII